LQTSGYGHSLTSISPDANADLDEDEQVAAQEVGEETAEDDGE